MEAHLEVMEDILVTSNNHLQERTQVLAEVTLDSSHHQVGCNSVI